MIQVIHTPQIISHMQVCLWMGIYIKLPNSHVLTLKVLNF